MLRSAAGSSTHSSWLWLQVRAITAAQARGENPYPHKFHQSIQLPAYVAQYASLEAGQQLTVRGSSVACGWGARVPLSVVRVVARIDLQQGGAALVKSPAVSLPLPLP